MCRVGESSPFLAEVLQSWVFGVSPTLQRLGTGARLRDAPAARAVLLSLARCPENPRRFSWCSVSTARRVRPPAPAPLPPCGHGPPAPGLLGSPQAALRRLSGAYNPKSWVFPPKPLSITLQPRARLRFLSKSPFEIPPEPPKAGGQEEIKEQVSPAPAAGKALQDPLCDPAPGQPCRRTERP